MTTIQVLDRPIAFHRCFVAVTGSVTGALFLSQAIYWQNRPNRISEDGWWYKTAEAFEEETGLTRRELDGARRDCAGIVLHKVKGLPAVSWYKVDEAALKTSLAKSAKLVRRKAPNHDGEKRQTICTETSSETSTDTGGGAFKASVNVVEEGTHVDWEAAEKWLDNSRKNGSDYTRAETRSAWLALEANGWMWGRNRVSDYRAAVERQIQTDRNNRRSPDTRKPNGVSAEQIEKLTRTIQNI